MHHTLQTPILIPSVMFLSLGVGIHEEVTRAAALVTPTNHRPFESELG